MEGWRTQHGSYITLRMRRFRLKDVAEVKNRYKESALTKKRNLDMELAKELTVFMVDCRAVRGSKEGTIVRKRQAIGFDHEQ